MGRIIFALITIALTFVGVDCSGKTVKVTEVWMHASPTDATTAQVFMKLENKMGADDTLTGATAYVAESAVIETTKNPDGTNQPIELPHLLIATDKTVSLSKNKTYILLKKLKQPLVAGEKFPIILTFTKAGTLAEDVYIQRASTITYEK